VEKSHELDAADRHYHREGHTLDDYFIKHEAEILDHGAIVSKQRMRTTGHNLLAQLMVQANWSRAKRFLAEILALGPEGWQAEENERTLLVGIDQFSEE
jgi:cytochrome b